MKKSLLIIVTVVLSSSVFSQTLTVPGGSLGASTNGTTNIEADGASLNIGTGGYLDSYIQVRKDSPNGVRFGLKTNTLGGIGLIQTGGSRGFGVKVNTTSAWNTITDPEFYINTGGLAYLSYSGDATLTNDGALTLGSTSGMNLTFDNNEIIARDNGSNSTLNLNIEGGSTAIGGELLVNGGLRAPNEAVQIGSDGYVDSYVQIRKNSGNGVRFGLRTTQVGSTTGIGMIQTGGARGFGIKVNTTSAWNTISDPEFFINTAGHVGIGTVDPQSKLAVNGQIRATEVKVLALIDVPDYVFAEDYELRTLKETKEYITENKHLPEIPSAAEIGENGIDLGDMNMRLLKKIEELTLYQIELMERLESVEETNKKMEKKLQELTN